MKSNSWYIFAGYHFLKIVILVFLFLSCSNSKKDNLKDNYQKSMEDIISNCTNDSIVIPERIFIRIDTTNDAESDLKTAIQKGGLSICWYNGFYTQNSKCT